MISFSWDFHGASPLGIPSPRPLQGDNVPLTPFFDILESIHYSVPRHETDWGTEYFFASLVKGDGVERPQRGMQRNGGINRNERSTGRASATIEVAERGRLRWRDCQHNFMSLDGDILQSNTVEIGSGHCPAIRRCSWRFAPLRLLHQYKAGREFILSRTCLMKVYVVLRKPENNCGSC